MRDHVRFFLNGQERTVRGEDAFATLAEYLRWNLNLCGTKVVCAEGDCGACTVLVGRPLKDRIEYLPVDACIQFVFQVDGTHVITVEGLGGSGELDTVQKAMIDNYGSQCGYCTPGIVMALAGWVERGADRDDAQIAMTGNLCRCTGYVSILEAMKSLTIAPPLALGQRPELQVNAAQLTLLTRQPLCVYGRNNIVLVTNRLADALFFKRSHANTHVVGGATEVCVWRNKRGLGPARLLSLMKVAELDQIVIESDALTFFANTTWSQVADVVKDRLPQFHRIIQRFGSPQIRNTGTLVGNIANGSPIADSLPLLSVMDAELEIIGHGGARLTSINGFYTGYKKKDLRSDEIITRVKLPLPGNKGEDRLRLYKVSRRNDLDIATFCAAIRLMMDGDVIAYAAIAYGGVAPTVVRLPKTEQFLAGQSFSESTFRQAGRMARAEVMPITDVRGSADFRLQLCENVLRKFYFDEVGAYAEAVA